MKKPHVLYALWATWLFLHSVECAADAALPPLEAFATLGSMREIELSPDGHSVAYLQTTPDGEEVVVAHTIDDARTPLIVPILPDARILWFEWLNDERLAVAYGFTKSVFHYMGMNLIGGRDLEQTRLYGFRLDGRDRGRPVRLAKGASKCDEMGTRLRNECPEPLVQHRIVDLLPDDPRHILLQVDSNLDGRWEVRRVDVKNGRFREVTPQLGSISTWFTDLDDEVRLGVGRDERNEAVAVFKPQRGRWRELRGARWLEREMRVHGFLEDPRQAIVTGPVNFDTDAIAVLDLEEDRIVEVLHEDPKHDLRPVLHDGRLIGYSVPARNWEFVPTASEWVSLYETASRALPDFRIELLSWSPDLQMLLLSASSDVEAGQVFVWDRRAGQMYPLGRNYPELDPSVMAEMEEVHYRARDDLEITAYLTRPRDAGPEPLPLVLLPHGGPHGRDTLGFDFLVQAIARSGYAVLQPNFRGSAYQGRSFSEAGQGEWGRKMQEDLVDGVRWASEQGLADPERVCIVGWSYGGYAALMGAVATPELFRCAASINGVADLRRLRGRWSFDAGYRRMMAEMLGPDLREITRVSPVHQASRAGVPILLVHARDDGRVPVEHSRAMAKALEEAGKEGELIEIERGGHGLMDAGARLRMLRGLIGFLDAHLEANAAAGDRIGSVQREH
ncbi:MAG: alpha/beta fold hydrolase [Pseudomonadales bacterium]|nr:alpha/beta fold hydrolase [Pseudomonadales bacterium]